MQTRREFCVHACQALSLTALGATIPACGGSPTAPSSSAPSLPIVNGTVVNNAVNVTIDSGSPLAAVGGAALVQSSVRQYLVSRTSDSSFTALTNVCTHEACGITGFQNSAYVCPCHGSRYNTSGAVLSGPASSPLRQFATTFANGVLTIAV